MCLIHRWPSDTQKYLLQLKLTDFNARPFVTLHAILLHNIRLPDQRGYNWLSKCPQWRRVRLQGSQWLLLPQRLPQLEQTAWIEMIVGQTLSDTWMYRHNRMPAHVVTSWPTGHNPPKICTRTNNASSKVDLTARRPRLGYLAKVVTEHPADDRPFSTAAVVAGLRANYATRSSRQPREFVNSRRPSTRWLRIVKWLGCITFKTVPEQRLHIEPLAG